MAKITLNDPNSGFNSATQITANNETIEDHLNNKVLYRNNPSGEANAMQNDLDMNSYRILNLPSATQNSEPVTYGQWSANVQTVEFTGYLNETFTATDGQTVFTLANAYTLGIGAIRAYINGVYQAPSAYTETDANTITFSEGLDAGDQAAFVISSFDAAAATGANNITYTPEGASAVATNVQTKLRESVSVKDFGATGDGVTDDTVAIEAALAFLLSTARRGILRFPPGTYIVSNTIVVSGLSIGIEGEAGETSTVIEGTHASGAVIQFKNRRQFMRNIEIDASAARQAGSGIGVLIEGDDTPTGKADFGVYENVYVRDQPSSGIVVTGSSHHCRFRHCTVRDSGHHGIVFDNGTLTSRTNKSIPGLSILEDCQVYDNVGHGLLVGNDNDGTANRGIRVQVNNCDFFRNADAAGQRKSIDQCWVFGDNCTFQSCGFDGLNRAQNTATTRAVQFQGRSNAAYHSRCLEMNGSAFRVEQVSTYPSNARIEEIHVVQTLGSDLDPAVSVDSANVDYVDVKSMSVLGIDRMITDESGGFKRHTEVAFKKNTETVTASTTLQNDDDLKISLLAYERVQFRAELWVDGPAAADIKIGFTVPAAAVLQWGPSNNIKIDSSLAVAVQNPVTSGSIVFGTAAASTTTLISIVGEVRTIGTAGDLQLQFAQNSSDAGNTRILARSCLEVLR